MSVSYYAYTVIGCEVTNKVRTKEFAGEGCPHNPSICQAFCPTCGKQRRSEHWVNAPGFDDDKITYAGSSLRVVGTTDHERLFAGVVVEINSWDGKDAGAKAIHVQSPTFAEITARVRSILEPLGFWDESAFGVWCVQYCSY